MVQIANKIGITKKLLAATIYQRLGKSRGRLFAVALSPEPGKGRDVCVQLIERIFK
jgi:hypothetical protein